jgi:serine phosphatase RsbU (regulator of sigma subunit)
LRTLDRATELEVVFTMTGDRKANIIPAVPLGLRRSEFRRRSQTKARLQSADGICVSLILNATGLLEEREPAPERDSPPSCGRVCESYLQEARLIQSSLLPTGPLAGPAVEIAYRLTPFFEVGGDFVDFFHLPDGLIGLFLGMLWARACRPPCTERW